MTAKTLADKAGADLNIDMNLALGQLARALTRSINLCTEDATALAAIATAASDTTTLSPIRGPGGWETVAASQTDQVMGGAGATGDYLAGVLIIPSTTSPGAVSIKDGGGSAITIFTGGASSVSNLVPFPVPLGMTSLAGAWKVTTGANVSAIGIGKFT